MLKPYISFRTSEHMDEVLRPHILLFLKSDFKKIIKFTLIGMIALFGVLFLTILISSISGYDDSKNVNQTVDDLQTAGVHVIPRITFDVILEEVLFRGIIFHFFGFIPAVILFGLAHFTYGSLIQILGATLGGYVLTKIRVDSGSLIPGIIAHLAFNLSVIFIFNG